MKKKAMVLVLLCVLGMAVFSVSNATAAAAPPWYNCTLTNVGSVGTFYFVQAADSGGAFGSTYFLIDSASPLGNQYLATALTGFANSTTVGLYLPSTGANSIIEGISAGPQ
jgi:hypothetical protein